VSGDASVLARMPKTELHVHLEGTIGPETLWSLAQTHGVALPAASLDDLRLAYRFDSFDGFRRMFQAALACLRDEAAYLRMTDDYLAECRRQNIRYAEAHLSLFLHERLGGIGGQRALDVICDRLRAAESEGGPIVRLILGVAADFLPAAGDYTLEVLERTADPIVVALGLGGPEVGWPRTLAAPWYDRARRAGYATVAHAGETWGAEHVRQAVEALKVRRVQHGVAAVEDPAVLALLAEREVCCDVTPTSNTFLTPYRDLASHPIRRMLAAGVPVTLSTDDPPFFGVDLQGEYERAHLDTALSVEQLWQVNLNGLRYGLAETGLRRRLMQQFVAEGRRLGIAS
jgi:aminodeoxyfutalosine deaminase